MFCALLNPLTYDQRIDQSFIPSDETDNLFMTARESENEVFF